MASKVYYTKKGQPYIKLASGKARFIPKKGAKKKRTAGTAGTSGQVMPPGFGSISLAALRKLARGAATCVSVMTNTGAKKICSKETKTAGLSGRKRKAKR